MQEKPHVTILDDDASICALISEVATGLGCQVQTHTNVGTFKEHLDPDTSILFLDLMMPDEDGIEVIRYLASIGLQAKIVLISGFDKRVLRSAAIMAKTQGLTVAAELSKPFSIKDLTLAIEQCKDISTPRKPLQASLSVAEIEAAIREDRIFVQYQPKIDLRNNRVFGAEALVRIRDENGRVIPPGRFIAVAEASGSIVEITHKVIKQALGFCLWLKGLGHDINVAINMPAQLLSDISLTDDLVKQIHDAGLRTDNITIEITESALVENYAVSLDVLARLRMKGVLLSIDDFGTGYSTMQQLKNIPFTEMKLDQSFVMDIFDTDARTIINKSIELSHDLGLRVLAEGVESNEVAHELSAMGCDFCQGYYYSRPIDPADFIEYLENSLA